MAAMMKDLYPLPGTRIKQWVVDQRREAAWAAETCPRVGVPRHDDNTGCECRNFGPNLWAWLAHDCCSFCDDLYEYMAGRPDIAAWLVEKAARPAPTSDRSLLSDEIEPDYSLKLNPLFNLVKLR